MNVVCIGAHPDDCEFFAGGVAAKWARLGHNVLFVSTTNGDIGHHQMAGGELARRRLAESHVSAERGGVKTLVLGYHDGELQPTLEARKEVVRIIRTHNADIVLTHRPNDYHPDHRYTSLLVQDAAFMVAVPHFCSETPALRRNPVFLYLADSFTKPAPFHPHIAVDVSDVMDTKFEMLDAMESQVYEWLPWLAGKLGEVPKELKARKTWLRKTYAPYFVTKSKSGRAALESWYGKARASQIKFAEFFEISEYGHQPSREEIRRLFPFFKNVRKR
ncbi:MAG: PIG-L family deacetylase [Candidatus Hydrogenedentes bacterium]|nr:PIG-L family deacetylase [Candidatus Hydrogenedentota bacterium]